MEQRKKSKSNQKIKIKLSLTDISALILVLAFAVNIICVIALPSQGTASTSEVQNFYGEVVNIEDITSSRIMQTVGVSLILAVAYVIFGFYLYKEHKEVFDNTKNITVIAILIAVTSLLTLASSHAGILCATTLAACLLAALLISDRVAVLLNLLLSLIVGLMYSCTVSLTAFESFLMATASALGGTFAVFALKNKKSSRGHILGVSVYSALLMCLVMLSFAIISALSFKSTLTMLVCVFVSAMICAFLAVGSLAVFESAFDKITPSRLNELLSLNHPLLKQLMVEAPGTYHHSMMAAQLAEAAAQSIGADHVLARVGACYHDVGKLRRPQYFVENQNGKNIHDTLSPSESAAIITSHARDSVQLLTKHKLPGEVIKIASEHHGDSLVAYFYNKALNLAVTQSAVNIKNFKYTGNKPTTKESAIVMLSDCCEAAVRSLKDTTKEKVEQTVRSVINSKIVGDDPQLKDAPLTVAEIAKIEKAFLKTFSAIMHERIQYPSMDKNR